MTNGFVLNVVAGILATIIFGIATYLYESKIISQFHLFIIIGLVLIIISLVIIIIKKKQMPKEQLVNINFHNILSIDQVRAKIKNASEEIWAFQISGGHHTRSLVEDYRFWLAGNKNRKLKIMFLNSGNNELVLTVGIMLGRIPAETINRNESDVKHFLDEINRTVTEYSKLKKIFPDQVNLRLYNCSPSCSVLGFDLNSSNKNDQVLVIENYIYNVPWSLRPCFTLTYSTEKLFEIYKSSLRKFFDDSQEYIIK